MKKTFMQQVKELYESNGLTTKQYKNSDDYKRWNVLEVYYSGKLVSMQSFTKDETQFLKLKNWL